MKRRLILAGVLPFMALKGYAQNATGINTITTAVPFLYIAPDARSGGMGEVGVATTPDVNSIHWNAAKLAFLEDGTSALTMTYSPWLRNLVPDINLAYVSFAKKIGSRQAFATSLRYFSLGDVQFSNEFGDAQGVFSPYEFAIDGAYSLKLSERLSGGIALRYIFSDLTQGQNVQGLQTRPGQSFAADLGFYYQSRIKNLNEGRKGYYSLGLAITNLGAKIAYTETGNSDFLPTNLRIGGGYTWIIDEFNKFSIYTDLNKLLVPTPQLDSVFNPGTGNYRTFLQRSSASAFQGVFQSFNDAPGGMAEEFREVVLNIGAEYWYDEMFAFRAGYQYEHETKGNRQYFTLGLGLRYQFLQLDMAYLLPANQTVRSPLENTLRFGLTFDLQGLSE
ncbi:MAG: type IX secretion system outer membrane channel protein PorV [Schleiferiaceae bacterium]|nr:type IX secretion system outer membrane channel protein PorV [Schleiferiaceae bacterium]